VLPGEVLAGEYPAVAEAAGTHERLARLMAAGVGCFIDLTQPQELPPYQQALPLSIEYLRKPIPDHAVPEDARHMEEILECLRAQLALGRVVYVHCRAGIGRSGMVAGCLLAERGYRGEGALAELNRRWRSSARSAVWESVPETSAQTDYVRNWTPRVFSPAGAVADPLLEPSALSAARSLRERFQGALLGLATGDAVAAATQYKRAGRFEPVGDMLGGGPFDLPRGAWSDDTSMALCLAESLLERGEFDARDQVERYRLWQQQGHLSATGQCLGITAGTARALARAQWRRQAFSGSHSPDASAPETLSRVTPVVMFYFADRNAAVEFAAEAARATSQAPAVLGACRALAIALHAALSGQARQAIVAQAQSALSAPDSRGVIAAAGGTAGGAPTLPAGDHPTEGAHAGEGAHGRLRSGTAHAALSAALEVFGRTDNLRDAVLTAANLGGNSDVVAGAAGALAGAHYSASAIPSSWRNSLMKKDLLEGFADRLLAHALLRL
jgi:ADP-ribosyl-[dinitrogen reductase] hydrolase